MTTETSAPAEHFVTCPFGHIHEVKAGTELAALCQEALDQGLLNAVEVGSDECQYCLESRRLAGASSQRNCDFSGCAFNEPCSDRCKLNPVVPLSRFDGQFGRFLFTG